jgi:hypothetical protein
MLAAVIPAGIALIIAVVFLIAPAAHAATSTQNVQFSDDGVHWSDSYAGSLFGGVLLVPGGSVDRAFYVRNNAGEPAVMRVTLYDVATTDVDLAAAMSLTTSTPGFSGAAVPVTDARPCATLSHGQVLAAGDSVRIDTAAGLADLNGSAGQAHGVSFKLAISLSSADSAAPAPDSCPTDFGGTVIGSPDPGTGTTAQPVHHLGAGGWTPAPTETSSPAPTPSATPTAIPAPSETNPVLRDLVGDTQRLYQEDFVLLWLAMAAIGAILFFIVRRRRSSDDDPAQHSPYSRQPATEIGPRP